MSGLLSISICANMVRLRAAGDDRHRMCKKMCVLPYQQGIQRRIMRVAFIALTACSFAAMSGLAPRCFASDAQGVSAGVDEEVTITEGANRTVFEYRQNGQLRAIKIVPTQGKPYYLVPADPSQGFGDLEHSGKLVPSWRIVEF